MAITSGAGPHFAWLNVGSGSFPIEHGSVEQQATRKASTFSGAIPLSYPGAESTLATIGDNTATVSVLTRGMQAILITGEIDNISFDYIGRTIRVSGRDKSAKLHENMSSEKWINKMGSDIVSDLAGRVGLSVSVDASGLLAGKLLQQDYVRLSDNVTFAQVIHKLAEFDGARWWVDPQGTLHYVSTSNPGGLYTLNYVPPTLGPIVADFMRLTITRNVQAGKTIQVTVKSWHPKDKKVYQKQSNVSGNGGPLTYNYHIPNLKQDHVDQHAKTRANEAARHELRLQASVVGDPNCNAGMGLVLTGTGYFDQQYQIDCVHHEIGMSGHRTNITARSGKSGRTAS